MIMARGPIDAAAEGPRDEPTPISGGVGIGIGFAVGIIALSLLSLEWRHTIPDQSVSLIWMAAAFAFPLLIIGCIDDSINPRARFKFVIYGAMSLSAAWLVGVVHTVPLGAATIELPYLIALIGTALWLFTMLNACELHGRGQWPSHWVGYNRAYRAGGPSREQGHRKRRCHIRGRRGRHDSAYRAPGEDKFAANRMSIKSKLETPLA